MRFVRHRFPGTDRYSSELRLLLSCLHMDQSEQGGEHVARCCGRVEDWKAFLRLAQSHGVLPIVYRRLQGPLGKGVPKDVMETLSRSAFRQRLKMLKLSSELVRLVGLMRQAGVPVLVLKGPALGMLLYADVSLRHSADLDLLVPAENVEAAEKILTLAGYRRTEPDFVLSARQMREYRRVKRHYKYRNEDCGVTVELHWKLDHWNILQESVPSWNNTAEVEIGGTPVPTLPRDVNMVFLCVHGAIHCWARLRWLLDIALLVEGCREIDWRALVDRAEAQGAGRCLGQGIILSHHLLGSRQPAPVQEAAEGDSALSSLVAIAAEGLPDSADDNAYLSRSYFRIRIARFLLARGFRCRLRYLGTELSPPADDWKTFPLPDRWFFLYWWIRPFAWFWRIAGGQKRP